MVYFTGAAGRYRADGTLEILRRLDRQIKIRASGWSPARPRPTGSSAEPELDDAAFLVQVSTERLSVTPEAC